MVREGAIVADPTTWKAISELALQAAAEEARRVSRAWSREPPTRKSDGGGPRDIELGNAIAEAILRLEA